MKSQERWENMTNEALLTEYKQSGDPELKKILVMRYSYLVKNVALKLRGVYLSFAQVDDMINEGIILFAPHAFEPQRQWVRWIDLT